MNFSGIIEMDEIPAIQELLKDAKSFCCYGFDCYERYSESTKKSLKCISRFRAIRSLSALQKKKILKLLY